jgi:hypothetical protein
MVRQKKVHITDSLGETRNARQISRGLIWYLAVKIHATLLDATRRYPTLPDVT